MQNIQELYERDIRVRTPAERLHLATLILNDIPPQSVTDYSETWTDEDIQDFRVASRAYVNRRLEEEENDE